MMPITFDSVAEVFALNLEYLKLDVFTASTIISLICDVDKRFALDELLKRRADFLGIKR